MRNPKSDIIIVVLFIHYSAHLILSKHDVIIAMSKKSRNPFSYRSESLGHTERVPTIETTVLTLP